MAALGAFQSDPTFAPLDDDHIDAARLVVVSEEVIGKLQADGFIVGAWLRIRQRSISFKASSTMLPVLAKRAELHSPIVTERHGANGFYYDRNIWLLRQWRWCCSSWWEGRVTVFQWCWSNWTDAQ